MTTYASKFLVPVRYTAWLSGELGADLHDRLGGLLEQAGFGTARITRLPRGFLVEDQAPPRELVGVIAVTLAAMEDGVQAEYPVFHKEMGPVFTGTLQVILPDRSRGV